MITYPLDVFNYNKYFFIYVNLIENAKIKNNNLTIYCEKHHILPSSIFPEYANLKENPWNYVKLTYREHFLAHWLLSKCMIQNLHTIKMLNAISKMTVCTSTQTRKPISWYYEKSKRAASDARLLLWRDPDFRNMREEQMNSPEYKEKRSKIAEQLWTKSEFRDTILKSKSSKEYRQKQSLIQKEAQTRSDVKEKKSCMSKANWEIPEIRQKYLESFSNRPNMWDDPEFVEQNTFYCELCQKTVKGKGNWNKHLISKLHQKRLNLK